MRVRESTLWAWGSVIGLTVLGAAAGAAVILTERFSANAFAGVIFAALFLSCGMAMQLYRRGQDYSTLVGALCGALSVFAFFAAPILVGLLEGKSMETTGAAILLIVAPLTAGAIAAAGTLFLASGVKRYRVKHGRIHAPR